MKAPRKEREGRKESNQPRGETANASFGQAVHNSLDAILESDFAKVNEQAETATAQSKLRQHLLAMNIVTDLRPSRPLREIS